MFFHAQREAHILMHSLPFFLHVQLTLQNYIELICQAGRHKQHWYINVPIFYKKTLSFTLSLVK